MQLATVKIVSPKSDENPHGYIVINESDFDEKKHELFEEDAGAKAPEKMNVAELKALLTEKGITFADNAKKADLLALVPTE